MASGSADLFVSVAKQTDFEDVISYLKATERRSREETGGTFLSNERWISVAHQTGWLFVAREPNRHEIAGFLVGGSETLEIVILEVCYPFREMGIGRRLVECFERRAVANNGFGCCVECQPRKSIPFWEHMGYSAAFPHEHAMGHFRYKTFSPDYEVPLPSREPLQVEFMDNDGFPIGKPLSTFGFVFDWRVVLAKALTFVRLERFSGVRVYSGRKLISEVFASDSANIEIRHPFVRIAELPT